MQLNIIIIILVCVIIFLLTFYLLYKQEKFETNNINLKLAIHTVLIMKENMPYLREWIVYHINLGFDKIYLYDNTGSIGRDGSDKNKNKYNINFVELINLTDEEVDKELQNILNDYKDNLIYIKWTPRDENNNIVYGYNESIIDYIKKYSSENDYTSFIDADEFIFSKNNLDLKQYILENGADKFKMLQKKFIDRFCSKNKKVIEMTECIDNINTDGWAIKTIIKNNKINISSMDFNMHTIPIKTNNIKKINIDDFRFNHYNVNNKQIEWMKGFYNKQTFDKGTDTSLLKYKNIIDKLCGDKCSDKNGFINNSYDLSNSCSFWS
jgi:hypothetical protein